MEIDDPRGRVLVTAPELARELSGDRPPKVLAVQSVNPYTGRVSERGLRIPGAIDTEAYTDFQAPSHPQRGQRPLPAIADLEAATRRWGVGPDIPIVVYDDDRSLTAARAWWVLRWAGLTDVRVLDGGLPAWRNAKLPLTTTVPDVERSENVLSPGHMPEFGPDDAVWIAGDGVLLDARIRQNYIGRAVGDGEPARGHIPGAMSAPAHDNLTDYGDFVDTPVLREIYRGLGVAPGRPVGVYCGAGMSAAHSVLALAALGIDAAMYPGSWSAYVADSSRPVRIGAEP